MTRRQRRWFATSLSAAFAAAGLFVLWGLHLRYEMWPVEWRHTGLFAYYYQRTEYLVTAPGARVVVGKVTEWSPTRLLLTIMGSGIVLVVAAGFFRLLGRSFYRSLRECDECGYDLRATLGRCPECGLVPATPPPSPPS